MSLPCIPLNPFLAFLSFLLLYARNQNHHSFLCNYFLFFYLFFPLPYLIVNTSYHSIFLFVVLTVSLVYLPLYFPSMVYVLLTFDSLEDTLAL